MASAGSTGGGEVMYDQRLFNQEKGMGPGFANDDQYKVYDKGLFTAQPTLSTLYRLKKGADDEMYDGADEHSLRRLGRPSGSNPIRGSRVRVRRVVLEMDRLSLRGKWLKTLIRFCTQMYIIF
ncbi:putative SKI-interacting protein, SKIP [Helianthus annuus]|nr:putative SKI-interacting protein, SKIP [Helianthus annuus]